MLSLLGDNIAHVEVAFRHPKAPNHIYKGTAQPDLQQKLQQLQDVGNHVQNALIIVREILAGTTEKKSLKRGPAVLHSLVEAQHHIRRAQAALLLPKKRQLNELQKNPLQVFSVNLRSKSELVGE